VKQIAIKRARKPERERRVLLGVVDLYLMIGRPIGSNTLRESGFQDLSSATIRNYFVHLEESGFLKQQHTSGGRVPTAKAYRYYAQEALEQPLLDDGAAELLYGLRRDTKEVSAYLGEATELLSRQTECAVFLAAPRFDHDFVLDIRLLALDANRCLCVIVTDFGSVLTEVIHTELRLTTFSIKRIESYLSWRLTGLDQPDNLEEEEEKIAQQLYNEAMVRFITRYSTFSSQEIYTAGFSRLLSHQEFASPAALARGLALLESNDRMRAILSDCQKSGGMEYWIDEDLAPYLPAARECAMIAAPYSIHQSIVGAVGIFGPTRMPYRQLFGTLQLFSKLIGEALSRSLYKFQIQYRHPERETAPQLTDKRCEGLLISQSPQHQGPQNLIELEQDD
jgi:heat-inducible transcriptional repressor